MTTGEYFVICRVPCPTCEESAVVFDVDKSGKWNWVTCPECKGEGYVTTQLPLITALYHLGIDVNPRRNQLNDDD
jgi:hypothetical protein